MGFITYNEIIPSDWQIDKNSTMSPKQKWEDISIYRENEFVKIIEPTQKIITHFGEKIGYIIPMPRIWSIQNGRLEVVTQLCNVIHTRSLEEIVNYFSNPHYEFYLSNVVESGIFKTYFIQFDNLPNLREQKLKSIGL